MKAYIYCDLTNRQAAVLVDAQGKVIQADPSVEFDGEVLGFLHSEGPEAAMDWIAWHPQLCSDLIEAYNVPGDVAVGPAQRVEHYDTPVLELPDNVTSVEDALQEVSAFGQIQGDTEENPLVKEVFEFEQNELSPASADEDPVDDEDDSPDEEE